MHDARHYIEALYRARAALNGAGLRAIRESIRIEVDEETLRNVAAAVLVMHEPDAPLGPLGRDGARWRMMGFPIYHPDEDDKPFARLVLLRDSHVRAVAAAPDVVETVTLTYSVRIDW